MIVASDRDHPAYAQIPRRIGHRHSLTVAVPSKDESCRFHLEPSLYVCLLELLQGGTDILQDVGMARYPFALLEAPAVEHTNVDALFCQQRTEAQDVVGLSGPAGDEQKCGCRNRSNGCEESAVHAGTFTYKLDRDWFHVATSQQHKLAQRTLV